MLVSNNKTTNQKTDNLKIIIKTIPIKRADFSTMARPNLDKKAFFSASKISLIVLFKILKGKARAIILSNKEKRAGKLKKLVI